MTEENGKTNEAREIVAAYDAQGDDAFEIWLRNEAAATYDKMKADPSRALSAKQVFDEIRARHFAKVAARA